MASGCRTVSPGRQPTTLLQSRLYPPSQGLWIGPLDMQDSGRRRYSKLRRLQKAWTYFNTCPFTRHLVYCTLYNEYGLYYFKCRRSASCRSPSRWTWRRSPRRSCRPGSRMHWKRWGDSFKELHLLNGEANSMSSFVHCLQRKFYSQMGFDAKVHMSTLLICSWSLSNIKILLGHT